MEASAVYTEQPVDAAVRGTFAAASAVGGPLGIVSSNMHMFICMGMSMHFHV